MSIKQYKHYKLQRAARGAVAVEFALVLIPLLILALGAAEFGRAIYQYNALVKATRDSVRHLSQFKPTGIGNYDSVKDEAKCLAVHGNIDCAGEVLVLGLNRSMVEINQKTAGDPQITLVEVVIKGYTFNFLLDPRKFLPGVSSEDLIKFDDISATMRQL
ncbi:TadE/TadG family type IV pilus assembly protein [Nitrosomonas sp. Nm34]|uniref:TadE/TadG family type IV pilus assembly protein n=1 Tax=Nitrosomonas sp. Nm34 TaxID=1881055 RepID=UPI0008E67AC7|nr:TadE family protein [Nitrosomonas sp. Nm34]SFI27476.1 TadE-like protein [Nitrosomonas sp. Nm34]